MEYARVHPRVFERPFRLRPSPFQFCFRPIAICSKIHSRTFRFTNFVPFTKFVPFPSSRCISSRCGCFFFTSAAFRRNVSRSFVFSLSTSVCYFTVRFSNPSIGCEHFDISFFDNRSDSSSLSNFRRFFRRSCFSKCTAFTLRIGTFTNRIIPSEIMTETVIAK